MADKQDYEDDNYHFADPDANEPLHVDPVEDPDDYFHDPLRDNPSELHDDEENSWNPDHKIEPEQPAKKNILRNALIAILIAVLLMAGYAFLSPLLTKKQEVVTTKKTTEITTEKPIVPQSRIEPEPVMPTPSPQPASSQVNDKLNALEQGQQSLRMEMNTLTGQFSGVQNNIGNLSAQISRQNEVLTQLSRTVTEQAQIIAALNDRLQEAKKPTPVVRAPKSYVKKITIHYFLKAIVPGRAWLVASNGSTLTVREGSHVPGYGVVKLIDAQQGRVVMRSGRVIRFSPEDS